MYNGNTIRFRISDCIRAVVVSCVMSQLRPIKSRLWCWSDQLTPGDFHLQNKKDAWWHWEVQDQERRWQIIDHSGARLVSRDSGVGLQECLTIRTSGPRSQPPLSSPVLLVKYPVQWLGRAVPVPDSVLIGRIRWIIIVLWQLAIHSNRLSKLGWDCCWEGPRFF